MINTKFASTGKYSSDKTLAYVIVQRPHGHGLKLEITQIRSDGEDDIEVEVNYTPDDFENHRDKIYEHYNNFLNEKDAARIKGIKNTLNDLSKTGKVLFNLLFGHLELKEERFISDMFNAPRGFQCSLFIKGKNFVIPYEFVCINEECKDPMNHFLGHKYVVSRRHTTHRKHLNINYSKPLLAYTEPTADLIGFGNIELKYFETLRSQNRISMHHLNKQISKTEGIRGKIDKTKFDILHLSCHFKHEKNVFDSKLRIKGEDLPLSDVSLLNKLDGKMIFLNACRSGNTKPKNTFSLTNEFVKKNAGAVISVEVDISDKFAARFSRKFYKEFFNEPEGINFALHHASMYFLHKEGDISGLFYSLYGSPRIPSR